jgi:hypothetical protein
MKARQKVEAKSMARASPSSKTAAGTGIEMTAVCHCGAVRIHVRQAPRSLVQCNCSICRRYGALWAYYRPGSVRIEAPPSALQSYSWRRKIRSYHRCGTCGCVTHYTYRQERSWSTVAVNAVNFDADVIAGARIRRLDGAKTWKFLE